MMPTHTPTHISKTNLSSIILWLVLLSLTSQALDAQGVQAHQENSYKGIVVDATTNKSLPSATVLLLSNQSTTIASTMTNDKGEFVITTSQLVNSLVVGYLGYKIYKLKLENKSTVLGEIKLTPDEAMLTEATITSITVNNKVDRTSYLVTSKMREQSSNAQELLDQIHGVRWDKLTNTIHVGTETSVLLLVDDMPQSESYIRNLSPDRIANIEVMTEPSGRYLSEGYGAVINFILKKDYRGYDINIRNMAMINLGSYNGDRWLSNAQPGVNFTLTQQKVNIFANYTYARIKRNTPVWRNQTYKDILSIETEKTNKNNSNNHYNYLANYIGGGINYSINPQHTLSYQVDYTYQKIGDATSFQNNESDIQKMK